MAANSSPQSLAFYLFLACLLCLMSPSDEQSCQRWHPLVCINQDLLLELRYIRDFHKIEGDERRQMTYSKAMAALKAYPHRIQSVKEAQSILAVGEKIAAQCGEYLKTGKIEAAGELLFVSRLGELEAGFS